MTFDDPTARRLAPMKLGECMNSFPGVRDLYMLDDVGYAGYLRCRDAARTMDESMACTRNAEMWTKKLDVEVAAEKAEQEAAAAAAEHLRAAEDAALARLDGLVAGGAIDASTIAEIRERRSSAPQSRLLTIVEDAAELIEAGRIAQGHPLAIQLPPADARMRRPGSMGAELVFVDAETARVVARIAPIAQEQFGSKNGDIEELLRWAAEDPERRDLEFVLVSSGFIDVRDVAPPDAFFKEGLGALKASGLAERRMLIVDGHAMTPGEWIKDPDPFQKQLEALTQGELDEQPMFPLVGKGVKADPTPSRRASSKNGR